MVATTTSSSSSSNSQQQSSPLHFVRKSNADLPGIVDNDNIITLSSNRNIEFIPADNIEDNILNTDRKQTLDEVRRHLTSLSDQYAAQPFVESDIEYDEYQTAWRYIGFMIDCNDYRIDLGDDDNNNGGGGSQDGSEEGCSRYVIWAAYVDLEYEGNGIGEYQFWDQHSQRWDKTPCKYAVNDNGESSSRCAKMDCHSEDTHFSLLGFFKHKSPSDWMEQLFKHEGFCVWNDEEYEFMSSARKAFPDGCVATDTYDKSTGEPVYYAIKPTSSGNIRLGLYSDARCMEEYTKKSVQSVLGNILLDGGSGDHSGDNNNVDYGFGSYSFEQALSYWDQTFGRWKTCHPCVAYDLNNVGYNTDDDASKGSSYKTYRYGMDDDYAYEQNGGYEDEEDFSCYDDADYTNVNQCMKFMAKTEMYIATYRDLSLASNQGTLVDYVLPIKGFNNFYGTSKHNFASSTFATISFLIISTSVLIGGLCMFRKVRREVKDIPRWMKKPLGTFV